MFIITVRNDVLRKSFGILLLTINYKLIMVLGAWNFYGLRLMAYSSTNYLLTTIYSCGGGQTPALLSLI